MDFDVFKSSTTVDANTLPSIWCPLSAAAEATMQNEPDTELDKRVTGISKAFASEVRSLASGPSLRDGLLRACLNDLVWELYFEFPDSRYSLQEELEGLASAVKDGLNEEIQKKIQETASQAAS